jgi:hypothetical protein
MREISKVFYKANGLDRNDELCVIIALTQISSHSYKHIKHD